MMLTRALIVILLVAAAAVYVVARAPSGPRSLRVFDPDRTADLELDMWRAYYGHQRVRLFKDLVTLLHDQNRYSWAKSAAAAFHLARAAATFSDLRTNYEQVLPDLERAYTISRDWNRAPFDPAAVARAELAWWVARREPGQDSPAQVGALIAQENALLYDVRADEVLDASVLRARAGRLRDDGGERADWIEVSRLLHESYRKLHEAVNATRTSG
jgi:hypothetical protein